MFLVAAVSNDDRASDKSLPNTRVDSSNDDGEVGNRALEEKMARLRRAQKLLARSQQPKYGEG